MEIVENREKSEVRVKKKTLMAVVEQCQRALESLNDDDDDDDDDSKDYDDDNLVDEVKNCSESSSPSTCLDPLAEESFNAPIDAIFILDHSEIALANTGLCDLIKSKVGGPEFLEKLQCAQLNVQTSVPEEGNSWDIVADNDLWESGNGEDDQEDYVVVRQEDIVDGIACFMAAYLLSLKETKDLAPKQLQDALSKTFSLKKKKGKLRKALDGTKVVYNVASWSATAIGIYQNPALLGAATTAFWTSCRIISRLF